MKILQINGPFYTNYSYSRMNRGLALALEHEQNEYKISIYGEKGKIDYWPSESDLDKKPELKKLFNPNQKEADVVIYNNFPKTLTNLNGLKELNAKTKLMYVAWEESIYPKHWVDEINENLHGVMAISNFTKEILQRSGVKIPVKTVSIALDDNHKKKYNGTYPLDTSKKFKFLHIGTGKLRKGVDLLLKAYFTQFTNKDNVVLVIKSSPGPNNNIDELIRNFKKENSPEVIHINNPDLTDEEMSKLINTCDCGVFPSRAEGFGLPILECMQNNVPVITTNYSGQLDFCNEHNSFLIDYKMVVARDSELINLGAKWAEPDLLHLEKLMRNVYETKVINYNETSDENRKKIDDLNKKIENAKKVANTFSWDRAAKETFEFVKEIESIVDLKTQNCAVLTFLNNESGIADYSEDLYKTIEKSFKNFYYLGNKDVPDRVVADGNNVVRTWTTGDMTFEESIEFIKKNEISIFHIQYHSGAYFPTGGLDNLIENLKKENVKVIVTLHSVRGSYFDFTKEARKLSLADRVIIHNPKDYEYASGHLKNLYLMQLPTVKFKRRDKVKLRKNLGLDKYSPIVATHGLLNINKSVPEIVQAINILKNDYSNILFLALTAVSANNIHAQGLEQEILEMVKKYNLEKNFLMINDFLGDEFIELFLQASDVNIFAYVDVGESSSAAIRKGLAAMNPVIVTDINMFQEFKGEVFKIQDNKPESIATGIRTVLRDIDLKESMLENMKHYVEENSYESRAVETLKLYTAVTQ